MSSDDEEEVLEEEFDNADFSRYLLDEEEEEEVVEEEEEDGEDEIMSALLTQQATLTVDDPPKEDTAAAAQPTAKEAQSAVARVFVCAADNPTVVKMVVCQPAHGIAAFLKLAKQKLALRWNPLVAYHLRSSVVLRDTSGLPAESPDAIVVAKKAPQMTRTTIKPSPQAPRGEGEVDRRGILCPHYHVWTYNPRFYSL